jgi:predicted nucleotidyltransferase
VANASRDFEELLDALNSHGVRHVIVGGYALALHGLARFTKDLDIFFDAESGNAKNLLAAVTEFIGDIGLKAEDFENREAVIQIGFEPVRVDFVGSIDGVTFEEVWQNRVQAKFGDVDANFISLPDLIKNKSSTGREQDALDVKRLKER